MVDASSQHRSMSITTVKPIEIEIARLLLEFALHLQQEEKNKGVKVRKAEANSADTTSVNLPQEKAELGPP